MRPITYSALVLDGLDKEKATFASPTVAEVTIPRSTWDGNGSPTMVWLTVGDGAVPDAPKPVSPADRVKRDALRSIIQGVRAREAGAVDRLIDRLAATDACDVLIDALKEAS